MCLRVAKAKQQSQSKTSSLTKPSSQPQRNQLRSPVPHGASSSALRLRCVALRGDTASQPVSIDGAPLGRIGTASARSTQHCAGSFRYLTPKKGKAGYQVSNKPFGSPGMGGTYGDVTRETMSSLFFRLSEVILSPVPLP